MKKLINILSVLSLVFGIVVLVLNIIIRNNSKNVYNEELFI
jgi:hypothetical protein